MTRVLPTIALLSALSVGLFAQPALRPDADPRIQNVVAAVSEARLREIVERLAGFGTRHALSDTTSSTQGIGAARQWIADELRRSSSKLQVTFDTHKIAKQGRITRDTELRNVMAVLPGRSLRRIYVTAHYDTVTVTPDGQIASNTRPAGQTVPDPQLRAGQDYNVAAPGANDNASGTALTMEVARRSEERRVGKGRRQGELLNTKT